MTPLLGLQKRAETAEKENVAASDEGDRQPEFKKQCRAEEDATAPTASGDQDEAAYWRHMFESLRKERITTAEAQLQALQEESAARDRALKNYTKQVEKELAEAKDKLNARESRKEGVSGKSVEPDAKRSSALVGDVAEFAATVKRQECIIERYQLLTSTMISSVSDEAFECTVANHERKIASKFRISRVGNSKSKDEETSLRCEALACPEHLPDFLRNGAIEFETSQSPSLMKNVLNNMFPEDEEE